MKRFTETDKWKDPWFRSLSPTEKLVFIFVIENCNNAGFYEVDMGFMAFATGLDSATLLGAIKGLARGLLGADGWLWVRCFLKHQKNDRLNVDNNAHKQIISLVKEQIQRFSNCPEFKSFLGANKGLFSPTGTGKGKVKVEEGMQGEGFEMFWKLYPRKDAKADAVKAWAKVPFDLYDTVLDALERQIGQPDWTKDGGKWIPYPASWLNGKRWEDAGFELSHGTPGTEGNGFL